MAKVGRLDLLKDFKVKNGKLFIARDKVNILTSGFTSRLIDKFKTENSGKKSIKIADVDVVKPKN